MNPSKYKFNTLILLTLISGLLSIIWSQAGIQYFTRMAIDTPGEFNISMILAVKSLSTLFIILPAIWVFNNPPKSLNKWMSFFLIMIFNFMGIIAYLVLMGIDCLQEKQQQTGPVK